MTASDRDEYDHGERYEDETPAFYVDMRGWGKAQPCTMTVNEPIEGTRDDESVVGDDVPVPELVTVQPGVYEIEDWDDNNYGKWYGIMVNGEMVIVSG